MDEAADPQPVDLAEAVWLAVPLGVSGGLTAGGVVTLLLLGASWIWPPPEGARSPPGALVAVAALMAIVELAVAFGLARLRRWARVAAFGFGAFDLAGLYLPNAVAGPETWFRVGIDVSCLAVLLPWASRWFDGTARERAHAAAWGHYHLVVTFGLAFLGAALLSTRFRAIFDSMNVELPWVTSFILAAGSFVEAWAPLVFPALVLGLSPVLRCPPERRPALKVVAPLGALLVLGSILAIFRPIFVLQRALAK